MKKLYYVGKGVKTGGKNAMVYPLEGIHSFKELAQYIESNPYKFRMTRQAWAAMNKAERTAFKEQQPFPYIIAGIPAGASEGKPRTRSSCNHAANLICLDIDKHEAALKAKRKLESGKFPWAFIAYETMSSRPEALHLRIIVDAEFPIEAAKYKQMVCHVAIYQLKLKKGDFDSHSETINQPMFLPVQFAGEGQ